MLPQDKLVTVRSASREAVYIYPIQVRSDLVPALPPTRRPIDRRAVVRLTPCASPSFSYSLRPRRRSTRERTSRGSRRSARCLGGRSWTETSVTLPAPTPSWRLTFSPTWSSPLRAVRGERGRRPPVSGESGRFIGQHLRTCAVPLARSHANFGAGDCGGRRVPRNACDAFRPCAGLDRSVVRGATLGHEHNLWCSQASSTTLCSSRVELPPAGRPTLLTAALSRTQKYKWMYI
jgi:hypothetical protein